MTDQERQYIMELYWSINHTVHPLLMFIQLQYGKAFVQGAQCKHYMPKYDATKQVTTIYLDEPHKPYTGKTAQIKEGRMITRMFPMLNKKEVTHIIEWWNGYKLQSAVHITQSDEEMEEVIRLLIESEQGAHSCMTRGNAVTDLYKATKLHAFMCYKHALGWSMAYTVDKNNVVTNRAIVNRHSMKFVRAYTTASSIAVGHTFQHALELLGYNRTNTWNGHTIELLDEPFEVTNPDGVPYLYPRVIVPYIDGVTDAINVDTGELVDLLDDSSNVISAKISSINAMRPIRCQHCGQYVHTDAGVADTIGSILCIECCRAVGGVSYVAESGQRRYTFAHNLVPIMMFWYKDQYFKFADKSSVVYSKCDGVFLDIRDAVWSYIHSSYVSRHHASYDDRYGYYYRAI